MTPIRAKEYLKGNVEINYNERRTAVYGVVLTPKMTESQILMAIDMIRSIVSRELMGTRNFVPDVSPYVRKLCLYLDKI